MAVITEKMLGQARPSTTTAETIYTLPDNAQAKVLSFRIANTGAGNVKFSIFVDNTNSKTYDESTTQLWETQLKSGEGYEEKNERGIFFLVNSYFSSSYQ